MLQAGLNHACDGGGDGGQGRQAGRMEHLLRVVSIKQPCMQYRPCSSTTSGYWLCSSDTNTLCRAKRYEIRFQEFQANSTQLKNPSAFRTRLLNDRICITYVTFIFDSHNMNRWGILIARKDSFSYLGHNYFGIVHTSEGSELVFSYLALKSQSSPIN